ncbi:CHASE2 domain-containing protein [Methanococcoides sp. SA1]|nr:CHASE2 domain-containing protein [Methanococcoides sp. SA1]
MVKFDLHRVGIFSILILLFGTFIFAGFFSEVRNSISDNFHGGENVLDSIVVVEISDSSLNEIGRWPWDRDVFAELLMKVSSAEVVGVDLSFFEETDSDEELREVLSGMDNVVLAAEITRGEIQRPVFDSAYGYVNLVSGEDGVIRSVRTDFGLKVKPFSLMVAEKYLGIERTFDSVEYINFVDGPRGFEMIDVLDVLSQGDDSGEPDEDVSFENKIVLIGVSAENIHDVHMVPTSDGISMAGVEVQAHVVSNFILDNFVVVQNSLISFLLVFLVGFLGLFLISKLKIHYVISILVFGILFYFLVGIFLFGKFYYIMDVFFFPLAMIVFTGVGFGLNYLDEKKHSAYLTDAFGKYVDKSLLGEIVSKKGVLGLGGQKRKLTIFFSDIRGFTSISEKLSPEDLGHLINRYFTEMTAVVLEHKGTIDKFIGDAVMAFWNAPLDEEDHALLGCRSALAQLEVLEVLNKDLKKEGLPVLKIGCGLHTGDAVVGNFGSDDRFDYTAFGDNVNLASRLEGLTKYYGVSAIVSEDTYKLVKDEFSFRKLDVVKVKGKKKPVAIYELRKGEGSKFVGLYELGLKYYLKSDFKRAGVEFGKALRLNKGDVACLMFVDRCKVYLKKGPGKDWDGAFEMTTK